MLGKNTIFMEGIGLVNLVDKLKKVYLTHHLRAEDLLNSNFINFEIFPAIKSGKKRGFKYKFRLVKRKWSFWKGEITKPYIEIMALDKDGIKNEEFGTKIIICDGGDEVANETHYWLERLVGINKYNYRERFDTPTSENDERFKELYGLKKRKPLFC